MLAFIFTKKLRPTIIGSLSGWLMLFGMMARPRATSERTNSGVILLLGCLLPSCALDVGTASLLIDHLIVQYVGFL
jgi:hypothetical protein